MSGQEGDTRDVEAHAEELRGRAVAQSKEKVNESAS
jgi:hypothetical protein